MKGFLDDDPLKAVARIMGMRVLGSGREAYSVVRHLNRRKPTVNEIIIAMPSASGPQMREALANCRAAHIPCKTVPGIDELLSGRVLYAQVRNPSVQDLLGRQQVRLDEAHVQASIAGRSVLVTGAAGSIGSELCRQVARFEPARLVAFDQAESDLFRIENELRERYPELDLVVRWATSATPIGYPRSCTGSNVESIFHAAAYKHVPMMESHVLEAVRNNVLGTWNLVRGAARTQRPQPPDDLIGQGREPDLRDGRHETRLRAHRLRALAGKWRDQMCFGALWKRPGQQRKRGAHFSGANRRRRAHESHPSGRAPLTS